MWCVLSLERDVIFSDVDWDKAVAWARRNGGELEIVFDEFRLTGDR